jgi:hypothetical protein
LPIRPPKRFLHGTIPGIGNAQIEGLDSRVVIEILLLRRRHGF